MNHIAKLKTVDAKTKAWKRAFVKDHLAWLLADILEDIRAGRIPPEWDGAELRELVADRTARATSAKLRGKLRKEYDNTKLVNNL